MKLVRRAAWQSRWRSSKPATRSRSRWRRTLRTLKPRRALSFAAGLVVMVALGGAALAGDVTGRDRAGDVKAKGLTTLERAALDIVSVRAIGDEGFGVVVVATFKGDVVKTLGRGNLRNALVAMILHPKSAAQKPAGLVTRGPGPGRTLRKTRSTEVAAVREGRTVTFIVAGSGYSNVGSVEVKAFDKFLLGAARSPAAAPPGISDAKFGELVNLGGNDKLRILIDSRKLNCDERRGLRAIILEALDDPELGLSQLATRQFLEGLNNKLLEQLKECTEPPPVTPQPPPLPPPGDCSGSFGVEGTDLVGTIMCPFAFAAFDYAPPSGFRVTNKLPDDCTIMGGGAFLHCPHGAAANTATVFHIQTSPQFGSNFGGLVTIFGPTGGTLGTFTPTGP